MRGDEYVEDGIQQLSDYRESVREDAESTFAAVRDFAAGAQAVPPLEPMPPGSIFGGLVESHNARNKLLAEAHASLLGRMVDGARKLGVESPPDVAALVDPSKES